LIEEGHVLPPPPNISELADSDYHVYERNLNDLDGELAPDSSCVFLKPIGWQHSNEA
jgi:hypothetical protein